MDNLITLINNDTCPIVIDNLERLWTGIRDYCVFMGQAYRKDNYGHWWQIGYGEPFANSWTDKDFGF